MAFSANLRAAAPLRCLCLLLLAGCKPTPAAVPTTPPPTGAPAVATAQLAAPVAGAYTGAYIAGEEEAITEDNVSLENIEAFEAEVGKHQALVAFSSYWGEQTFPAEAVDIVSRHHSVPLIFWSPWDRPYIEDKGPDKYRLDAILAGKWDAYVDRWADAARDHGGPILVSFCNEMNGNWFPWSGFFYGAGDPATAGGGKSQAPNPKSQSQSTAATTAPAASPPPPGGYAGPEFFKRTFRHVVDRVRARGAHNVQWVFHVNNFSEPYAPWNAPAQYYPGPDYVDWMGLSVYGQQYPNGEWKDFDSMLRTGYDELCRIDPDKPLMVTEWGVGEFPKRDETNRSGGDKGQWIAEALVNMRVDFPRIRAAIYWNERWQNSGGASQGFYSNLRVNSSPGASKAYRDGVALPFWLGDPILK